VQAGPSDGSVVGAVKIFDNGPASDRYDVVLLAEGYTAGQQAAFAQHAQEFLDFMLATPPFSTNCSALNVWRIDVISDESGADDPTDPDDDFCKGASGDDVDTYFDATFCAGGSARRLLVADSSIAETVLNAEIPGWDQALVIVNSNTYGGGGGAIATTSVSGTWENIAIHEWGHSGFNLADEYQYYLGCGTDTDRDNHPGPEPAKPNVTIEDDRALVKWADLIDIATPVPTTSNDDCSMCDDSADPFPGDQVVGIYEGAHYYHCDSFRPVFSCMMRDFAPFCPVCTRRILEVLDPYQPANQAPICDANGPIVAECEGATTQVELDGSGSSDPDCDPMTLEWAGDFSEGMAEGVMPIVTYAGLGTSMVDLEVSDDDLASACETEVTIEDTTPPDLTAPGDVMVECTGPDGTAVELGVPLVSDICDPMVAVTNDAPAVFPIGVTLVTWTATDDSDNEDSDTQLVSVVDTTPPVLTLSLDPDSIWPPNHKLHTIHAAIEVTDICDPDPTVELVSVVSSEPDNDRGDGHTTEDVQGVAAGSDDRSFEVRAERDGRHSGRTYTARYTATDDSDNQTMEEATVRVEHDQGN